MARRLIIDTGVLLASERGRTGPIDVIAEDDDLVIAAITVAELRTGVELATERHRGDLTTPPATPHQPPGDHRTGTTSLYWEHRRSARVSAGRPPVRQ